MSRRPGLSFQHETQRGHLAVTALLFKKKHAKEQAEKQTLAHLERRGEKGGHISVQISVCFRDASV